MFEGCEHDAHLLKIVQYALTLLEQTIQVLKPARVASCRFRRESGCRNNFVATVAEEGPRTQQVFRRGPYVYQDESCNASPNSIEIPRLNRSHHCRVGIYHSQQGPLPVHSTLKGAGKVKKKSFQKRLPTVARLVCAREHTVDPEP